MKQVLPRSLFGQLVLAQIILFGVIAFALPALLFVNLHRTEDRLVVKRLRADVNRIAARLEGAVKPSRRALTETLGPAYHARWGARAYRVSNGAGEVLYQGGVVDDFGDRNDTGHIHAHLIHRGDLDIAEDMRRVGGHDYFIAVAQDRSRPEVIVDDVVTSFLRWMVWIIPLIFLGSSLVSLWFFRRLTANMRSVARDADKIGPLTLDMRLDADRLPLEARSLAAATNRALDRVEQGYKNQAGFAASVAHELRTPLALVSLRCDALHNGPEKDALQRAIDQAAHVVSQLMELAAIDGPVPVVEDLDIDRIARETVEANAPLVYRSNRSIEVVCQAVPTEQVAGNEQLLRIALANLIDNAVRHTGEGTHIVVTVRGDAMYVRDNGPGILVDQPDDDRERRYRSASANRTDGAGLGLSIVQRIMTAMGGGMAILAVSPGALVVLRFRSRR